MRDELKARIAQINAGTAPAGYKKTKVGIVPEEWDYKPFEEYASVKSKKYNPITDYADYPCIEMEHLQQKTGTLLGTVSSKLQASIKNLFECGDILYGKLRPYLRKYYLAEFNGVCSTEIWVLKAKKSVSNLFLYYTIQSERFNGLCDTSCIGSKMPRADWDYVSQHLFAVPPLPEQQKIAEILTAQDAVIALMQKQIELKQQQKKYLMQKLLSGELRVGDGEWKKTALKELIAPQSRYTDDLDNYPLYSLTIESGVIPKPEQYERSHLVKKENGYKIVMPNEFVYNPMNIRFGAVARHKCDFPVAVSGYYDIFEVKYPSDYVFFDNYLVSYNMLNYYDRVSTGSLIEKKRVHFSQFLEFKFYLPDKEERKQISEILSAQDKEIELLQQQLDLEQQKKKALMQLLLSGKVRVESGK